MKVPIVSKFTWKITKNILKIIALDTDLYITIYLYSISSTKEIQYDFESMAFGNPASK